MNGTNGKELSDCLIIGEYPQFRFLEWLRSCPVPPFLLYFIHSFIFFLS